MLYVPDNFLIFEGFYESRLYSSDWEYDFNAYGKEPEEPEYEIDDWDEYRKDVCLAVTDELRTLMCNDDGICTKVEYIGFTSPRYYNFSTDKIELEIDIDLDKLKDWVLSDDHRRECFDTYLRKKYTSYDGFLSFVDNNVEAYFSDGGSFEEFPDVLIDYYVLCQMYGNEDMTEVWNSDRMSSYHYSIYEAVDEIFYEHMAPIEDDEPVAEAQ